MISHNLSYEEMIAGEMPTSMAFVSQLVNGMQGTVVYADTDSIMFTFPSQVKPVNVSKQSPLRQDLETYLMSEGKQERKRQQKELKLQTPHVRLPIPKQSRVRSHHLNRFQR